jgi:hypothetical protein
MGEGDSNTKTVSEKEFEIALEGLKEEIERPSVYGDPNQICFQFWGWCIMILPNGKWFIEDTSGG